MARKRMKGCKYRRVSQQQKYIFLKLCITEQQSIHEAAYNAGIHYSTAKTILFFHKKNYKNYSSYYVQDPEQLPYKTDAKQASWKAITIDLEGQTSERQPIEIIVDSKVRAKQTNKQKYNPRRCKHMMFSDDDEENPIKVEAESEEIVRLNRSEISNSASRLSQREYNSDGQKISSGQKSNKIAIMKREHSQNGK